jgi:4-aminobutyrate aminotransferase-like enzyme
MTAVVATRRSEAMGVMPPLTIRNEEIQEGLAIMNEVLLSS